LQYAKADVVTEKLKARIDANAVGSLTMDERSNQIIIRAIPGRRDEVMKIIKSLDVPTKEVLVEARVLQVVFKPQYEFGIDWTYDFSSSPYSWLRSLKFNPAFANSNILTKRVQFTAGEVNVDEFTATINALKQVNDTKILSNPKLLVTNNEEAKIHIGDTVPYIISTTSGTGDNAITSEDVRFVDVGLKLNVTPTINDDGFVTMRLAPEISTVVDKIQSKGGGIPQVNKTLVETTVMVKDGETIVLGGLKKDNKSQIRQGVPVLMDVPFIRKIFSNTSESIESTEIVIFITPHIIKDFSGYGKFKPQLKPSDTFKATPKVTAVTATTPMASKSASTEAPSEESPNGELKLKE
jgi:general secretion pathway protein D